MSQRFAALPPLLLLAALLFALGACGEDPNPPGPPLEVPTELRWTPPSLTGIEGEIVVYTALDERHSKPLIRMFEERTGLAVRAVYDTEQTKTVGLVNRIRDEKAAPLGDVFWNNEIAQTLRLRDEGLTVPFEVSSATSLPARWRDPEKHWCGFAARARVFIVSKPAMKKHGIVESDIPRTMNALVDSRYKGLGCIAKPLTGTTATHATALFSLLGEIPARTFFTQLLANEIQALRSNGATMRAVSEHRFPFGLTDTDDYHVAVHNLRDKGKEDEITIVYPDSAADQAGTMLIPNTVCKIKGGPNPRGADVLIDWILSPEVEYRLAQGLSAQIPVRSEIPGPEGIQWNSRIKILEVDWNRVAADLSKYEEYFHQTFIQ